MGRRFPDRRPAGELESEVLGVLWAADAPLVPAQVRDALDGGPGGAPAYTTVLTTLTRLYEKGVVTRAPAGRSHAYQPVLDEPGIVARQMRVVMDKGGDRVAALRRFLTELPAGDAAVLADALRQVEPGSVSEPAAATPDGAVD
jgi:predicted transcriptional regulator